MDLTPHLWQLWILAAVGAAALELHLANFVLIWFALGGLASALAAGLGASVDVQLLLFLLSSIALFTSSRTIFRKLIAPLPELVRHGDAALLGEEAVVTQVLGEADGAVRMHGELWMARSLEGAIAPGERVQVERVDGLKLYVRRLTSPVWSTSQRKEPER